MRLFLKVLLVLNLALSSFYAHAASQEIGFDSGAELFEYNGDSPIASGSLQEVKKKISTAGISKGKILVNFLPDERTCREPELGVFLGRIYDFDELYLNGNYLGSIGSELGKLARPYQIERVYRIPSGLMQCDGSVNKLMILFSSSIPGRAGIINTSIELGNYGEFFQKAEKLAIFKIDGPSTIGTVLICLGVLFFFLFFKDERWSYYRSFSGVLLLGGLLAHVLSGKYFGALTDPSWVFRWTNIVVTLYAFAIFEFISRFLGFGFVAILRTYLSILLCFCLFYLLIPDLRLMHEVYQWQLLVQFSILPIAAGWLAWKSSKPPSVIVQALVGLFIILIGNYLDIARYWQLHSLPNLSAYSLIVGTGGFSLILISQLRLVVQEAKSDAKFAAMGRVSQLLAHDLRKPFSMLQVVSDCLKNLSSPEEVRHFVKQSVPEINSALSGVNGLLEDLMTVGDESPKVRNEPVSVSKIFDVSLKELARIAPDANVTFVLEYDEDIVLAIDELKIRRVFSNILVNAVQAMRGTGQISICARVEGKRAEISIENSNSFIESHQLPFLFDAFYTEKKRGGTGLGLSIAKKWVEAHGGVLICSSQKGATQAASSVRFVFDLPLCSSGRGSRMKHASYSLKSVLPGLMEMTRSQGNSSLSLESVSSLRETVSKIGVLRILLLEDENVYVNGVHSIVSGLLTEDQFELTWVRSVDELKQCYSDWPAHIVLFDIDLASNDEDGYDGLALISSMRSERKCASILCVHSNRINSHTLKESVSRGADIVLPKPLAVDHFAMIVSQLNRAAPFEVSSEGGSSREIESKSSDLDRKALNKPRIAIVDDSAVFRLSWKIAVGEQAEVVAYKSSRGFLDCGEGLNFDLVITDFYLGDSEPTGKEVAVHLRERGYKGRILLCSCLSEYESDVLSLFDGVLGKDELPSVEELLKTYYFRN